MSGEILAVIMFATAMLVLMAGFPVAFTLGGVGLGFAFLGDALGVFRLSLLGALPSRWFGFMTNELLLAVPLFIFMGVMLERSRIAEDLLETMGLLFGRLRGGLGVSVVVVGGLMAASTGIAGATVTTMGLISLPAMLKAGYDRRIACGVICASGTLGQIVPPSIVLILLGDFLANSWQQAQLAQGIFAPETLSVIDLFAGALLPGLTLAALYVLWLLVTAWWRPASQPVLVASDGGPGLTRRVLVALVPPALLILAVLGSILGGVASPTESAAVGAAGALVLAALRRQLSGPVLRQVVTTTMEITTMVFVILMGASVFSLVFRGLNGEALVADLLADMPGGEIGALLVVMAVIFVMGFFLDVIEIIFVVVPIVAPVLLGLGVDPVWLGVMIAINLQTSFLTPPFGFALFFLRGVAPPQVPTTAIYRGAVPFVVLQLAMLILLALVPELATWLPTRVGD